MKKKQLLGFGFLSIALALSLIYNTYQANELKAKTRQGEEWQKLAEEMRQTAIDWREEASNYKDELLKCQSKN